MTRDTVKAFLPIIIAYGEGKTIQIKNDGRWENLNIDPNWSMHPSKYRIKPEPKTVPLTIEDLYEHFKKGTIFTNSTFRCRIIGMSEYNLYLRNTSMNFDDFMRLYTFEDGTPLVKTIEE